MLLTTQSEPRFAGGGALHATSILSRLSLAGLQGNGKYQTVNKQIYESKYNLCANFILKLHNL
ncbi:hypothetical protein D0Y50_02305 [Salinimonas sediminis]|uniref:Uncharacterized protein n=1 Tax=Salinimonas sediminis TaxID=2303538 RepID=A0A346NIE4_9ALTE|nr:hypothetical protein D0Y50_02305 [Salinimonas sediminis]